MSYNEIKKKLIEIVTAMVERSEDITGLNMSVETHDYIVNISLDYEIVPKEKKQ